MFRFGFGNSKNTPDIIFVIYLDVLQNSEKFSFKQLLAKYVQFDNTKRNWKTWMLPHCIPHNFIWNVIRRNYSTIPHTLTYNCCHAGRSSIHPIQAKRPVQSNPTDDGGLCLFCCFLPSAFLFLACTPSRAPMMPNAAGNWGSTAWWWFSSVVVNFSSSNQSLLQPLQQLNGPKYRTNLSSALHVARCFFFLDIIF